MAVTDTTKRKLLAASGNRCAHPDCNELIFDLEHQTLLGQICHIKGSKPKSARYDVDQPDNERHGFDNLIALCRKHHTIIDDNPDRYAPETISKWKVLHENRVSETVEIGHLGEITTTLIIDGGGVSSSYKTYLAEDGTPRVMTEVQEAVYLATIDFQVLLSGVNRILEMVESMDHESQIHQLQQLVEEMKLKDSFLSSVYHILFELQDLTVGELAVARTQGDVWENREKFRELGEELLDKRMETKGWRIR